MKDNCPPQKVEVRYVEDLPIDNLDSLPDYLLAIREVVKPSTGVIKADMTRVPTRRLFPNGNYDNVVAISANNEGFVVPENQVRAAYVANEGNTNVVHYADASHRPMFLAVGTLLDQLLVQNTGFINLPNGHSYVIGAQYYVGQNGEPVTDSASWYKLFIPISPTKLAINME